jgi:hypothetical protein
MNEHVQQTPTDQVNINSVVVMKQPDEHVTDLFSRFLETK